MTLHRALAHPLVKECFKEIIRIPKRARGMPQLKGGLVAMNVFFLQEVCGAAEELKLCRRN